MKFIHSTLTVLPALATAKVLIAVGPSQSLAIGDTYDVEWLVDTKMVSNPCTLPEVIADMADPRAFADQAKR